MNERKIGGLQFAAILIITTASQQIYTISHPTLEHSGLVGILIDLVYLLTLVIILLPSYFLLKKSEDKDIITMTYEVYGKFIGKMVSLLFLSVMMYSTIVTFAGFSYFMTNAEYFEISSIFFFFTMYALVIYAYLQGIEGISRVVLIILFVFCIGMFIVFLTTFKEVRPINLNRPQPGSHFNIIGEGILKALDDSVAVLALLMVPKLRGKAVKPFVYSMCFITLISSSVLFLTSTIFSKYQEKLSFVFYTLTTIADVNVFRDISTIYLTMWIVVSFARLAVYMFFVISLIKQVLPQKHSRKALPVSMVIFIPVLLFLQPTMETLFSMANSKFFIIITPVLVIILPILLAIGIKLKKKRGEIDGKEKEKMDTAHASVN